MELTLDQTLQKGIAAHKAGKAQEADHYYSAILKAHPKHPDANHNMGVLAVGIGKVQEALPFFKAALEANTNIAQFWLSYIDALIKLNRLEKAKDALVKAKSSGVSGEKLNEIEDKLEAPSKTFIDNKKVTYPDYNILDRLTLNQALKLGGNRSNAGFVDEAKLIYNDILFKFPKNIKARERLNALKKKTLKKSFRNQNPPQNQVQFLLSLYKKGEMQASINEALNLLSQFPNSFILYNILGTANASLGFLKKALDAYNQALSINPVYVDAYNNIGVIFQEQGKFSEALDAHNQALSIKPDCVEALYNIGNALKKQRKLEKAIVAYNQALSIKPDYAEVYNNIGNVLKDQGKLEEAVNAYNQALSIKPDYAGAYNNIGNAFKEQGKLDEAVNAYNQALSIKPDYAEVYYNIGNALKEQGKLDKTVDAYNQALSIKPDYVEVYYNLGCTFQEHGKLVKAVDAYNKALSIKPDYAEAYYNLGSALKGVTFNQPNISLQKQILSLLNDQSVVSPADITTAAVSLLKHEKSLKRQLIRGYPPSSTDTTLVDIAELTDLPLLIKLMSVCPIPDLEIERLLKNLRKKILSISLSTEASQKLLRFQSALALQCFINEYIYGQTKEEINNVETLETSVKLSIKNREQPSPGAVLSLACYKAINQYSWYKKLVICDEIRDVFIQQIEEPNQEKLYKSSITSGEKITNKVSSKVKNQYEQNPYPRWVKTGLPQKQRDVLELVAQIKLKIFDNSINEIKYPDILVAGCGTGQHAIVTASRFKNSRVVAIDLSLSSLSYAKRKTEELSIKNIDYTQADILRLDKLNKKFDIIESGGVLHHMDKPIDGWKVLTDRLKPGGLMKIGLYSELARTDITEIRKEIFQSKIGSSPEEMQEFRDLLKNSANPSHKWIAKSPDFYSLSAFRDLIFHVREHTFTIPQIHEYLSKLGLKFCGFETDEIVSHFKKTNKFPDDPYDLNKWHEYEKNNPKAFAGMYQIWCQKIN